MKLSLVPTLLLACFASVCCSQPFPDYPSLTSNTTCPSKTTPLYFGLIMSFNADQFDGSGAIAGVKLALDRINSNCSLLPGYSLHYTLADSKCRGTDGLDALFEDTLLTPDPKKIAIIGSGCSLATEPTAKVSHYYNISHISCVSSSPALTDRTRFRRYFQLLNSAVSLAYAHYGVIKEYGWGHVSLIVQDENLFTAMSDELKMLLTNDSITFDERVFSTKRGISDLGDNPFNTDRRIHLIASYSQYARQLICEAHRLGIHLPRHVLLTPGWYNANWWKMNDDGVILCPVEEREMVLKNSLAFLPFIFLDRDGGSDVISEDGLTDDEFLEQEATYLGIPPLNLKMSGYAQFCYDATWTLVYALEKTLVDIEDEMTNRNLSRAFGLGPGEMFRLNDFTYENDALVEIIFQHLAATKFDGITGPVKFSDQGIRESTRSIIYQFKGNNNGSIEWVEIGRVTAVNQSNYIFNGNSSSDVWPDGIPSDGVPDEEIATIHLAVTSIYFTLTTAGIAFAVVCLVFNFVFRDKKLIKLTSPNLNLLIVGGAIVLYFNLYLFIFPVDNPTAAAALCNLTPWLTAIGYSLCYGTIVAKMTRVYYIFNSPSSKKTKVHDWKLFLGVLALVVVDVIILLVYTAVVGQAGLQAHKVPSAELEEVEFDGKLIRYFIFVCDTPARDIMLGVLYGYKALLQVIALVFSFSIRRVKVKGLDDAIFIAVSIYVSSIVLAVILVSTYTLKHFLNVFPVVFCTGFLFGTTAILCLVFIPLMVGLYKDPKGETIFDKSQKSMSSTLNNNLQTHTIEGLRKRVTELEAIMSSMGGAEGVYRSSSQVVENSTSLSGPTQMPPVSPHENRKNIFHDMVGEPPRERAGTIWDDDKDPSQKKVQLQLPSENGTNHI